MLITVTVSSSMLRVLYHVVIYDWWSPVVISVCAYDCQERKIKLSMSATGSTAWLWVRHQKKSWCTDRTGHTNTESAIQYACMLTILGLSIQSSAEVSILCNNWCNSCRYCCVLGLVLGNWSAQFYNIFSRITTKSAPVTGAMSYIMQELDVCKKDLICHQAVIGAKTQLMIVKWGMIAPS